MAGNTGVSGSYTADSETDLYTNSSGTAYAISLKLGVYNPDSTSHKIEIWRTDGSNTHLECLYKGLIAGTALMNDGSKTWIPPGHKIRFKSDDTDVQFTIHVYEGVS